MTASIGRHFGFAAVVLAAAACTGVKESPKVPLGQVAMRDSAKRVQEAHALLGPAAKAALDSGNALFRKKQYAPALALYRNASDVAPQHAAPIFGIYMVARATNNMKLADSALAEIRKRNGEPPAVEHGFSDSAVKDLNKKLGKAAPGS